MASQKHRSAIAQAAATLFRKNGYAATSMADIIKASGAPKGSVYHYFPAGKPQIAAAAVTTAGQTVQATLVELANEAKNAGAMIQAYADLLGGWLAESIWRDGSPIATALLEVATEDQAVRLAGLNAYAGWRGVMAERLVRDGVEAPAADLLAGFAISALEGALIQARVEQSDKPLIVAGEVLAALFRKGAL